MVSPKQLTTAVSWLPALAFAGAREEGVGLNLPRGVTPIAHDVYSLHMLVFWICLVIGLAVFAVMAWSLFRHRRSAGAVPARFSGNTRLEIVWTVIPVLILVVVAAIATPVLLSANSQPDADVTVDIRGSQWKWHYAYAGSDVAFFSNLKAESREAGRKGASERPQAVDYYLRDVDHPLVLPVGETIRLRLTSDDVIHSWWVPELGFKRDAIPGYINQVSLVIEKPGTYRGQCAELCGAGHALMPIVVEALPPEKFHDWLAQREQAEEKEQAAQEAQAQAPWSRELAERKGKSIYASVCAACHQPDGKGIPGTFPALDGSPVVTGPPAAHIHFVVHGSPKNPVMRPFGKEMDDRQLAAVITYERNAWGNHSGDLVTPEQVEEAR